MRAFSTLRILPLIGRIAWKRRSRPCFAVPPAEALRRLVEPTGGVRRGGLEPPAQGVESLLVAAVAGVRVRLLHLVAQRDHPIPDLTHCGLWLRPLRPRRPGQPDQDQQQRNRTDGEQRADAVGQVEAVVAHAVVQVQEEARRLEVRRQQQPAEHGQGQVVDRVAD